MTRTGENDPSPRQQEALDWIRNFIHEHGIPPTIREIGQALGIKSSSAFDLLQALERKGLLKRGDLGARSLIITGERQCSCGCADIPVVGRIAESAQAGFWSVLSLPPLLLGMLGSLFGGGGAVGAGIGRSMRDPRGIAGAAKHDAPQHAKMAGRLPPCRDRMALSSSTG